MLAFYAFPVDHRRKIRSTNPLERVNREIGRRTDVVRIFPNDRALLRLATSLVIKQNDEWLVGRRYLSARAMEPLLVGRRTDVVWPAWALLDRADLERDEIEERRDGARRVRRARNIKGAGAIESGVTHQ